MTRFVEIPVGPVVMLAVRLDSGRVIMLYPSHNKGECHRPGQRMKS